MVPVAGSKMGADGDVRREHFHVFILACRWERGVGYGSGVAGGGLGWNDAECLPLIAIDRTIRIINNYQGVNLKNLDATTWTFVSDPPYY